MKPATKKIVVMGAGIGGLTAAHELARRGFNVTVYERNPVVGGLARSMYHKQDGFSYPVEYSWRVYGTGYKNLLRLLKEIPLQNDQSKSVYDNLVYTSTYIFPRFDDQSVVLSRDKKQKHIYWKFTRKDKWQIIKKILYCITMSSERMNAMDDLRWSDFCADLSPEARKFLVTLWGPVLGMDPTKMSFPVVARFLGVLVGGWVNAASALYVMNKPTNDAWFDEWTAYLKNLGVTVNVEHEVTNLNLQDGEIKSVDVVSSDGRTSTESADYIIAGLSVESVAKLVTNNPELQKSKVLSDTITLADIGRQIQLSVQIFFDQEIQYHVTDKPLLYLPDTPWALIIEPQGVMWNSTYCTDPRVKAIWSTGICQTDAPGIIHNKPFTKCSPKEIREEVMAQIKKSTHLSNITMRDESPLCDERVVLFYLWDSFTYDRDRGEINVWEPKFSNNAGALQYQPSAVTDIENLFFATAYTKTDRFIYSMESATEAGILAANAIVKKEGRADSTPVIPFHRPLSFLRPMLWLDRQRLKRDKPHFLEKFSGSR